MTQKKKEKKVEHSMSIYGERDETKTRPTHAKRHPRHDLTPPENDNLTHAINSHQYNSQRNKRSTQCVQTELTDY